MSNDIWDWLGFAIKLASFLISLIGLLKSKCRRCRQKRERFRSFKGWGIEWVSYDRDDKTQS